MTGFFDDTPDHVELKKFLTDSRSRLHDNERKAFEDMLGRFERGGVTELSPKQRSWLTDIKRDLAQNRSDVELLESAIDAAHRKPEARAAFEDMLERIGVRGTLTAQQREWAERIASEND